MSQAPIEKDRKTAALGEDGMRISWTEENVAAIAERRSWIEVHGAPLADLQVLKIDGTWPAAAQSRPAAPDHCWPQEPQEAATALKLIGFLSPGCSSTY
jgi:hypothetical protein